MPSSNSQKQIDYWWTKPGTKDASHRLVKLAENVEGGDLRDHIVVKLNDAYGEMCSTNASSTPGAAGRWGQYRRMLELYDAGVLT